MSLAAVLVVGSVAPASAEFFGCNEPRTKVSYSSSNYRGHFAQAPAPRQQRYTSQSEPEPSPHGVAVALI